MSLICRSSDELAIRSMLCTTSLSPFGCVMSLSWKEEGLEQSLYLLLICLAKSSQSQLQWQCLHLSFMGLFSLLSILLDTVLVRCFTSSLCYFNIVPFWQFSVMIICSLVLKTLYGSGIKIGSNFLCSIYFLMRTLSPPLMSSSFRCLEQLICSVLCCFNPFYLFLALIHSFSVIGFLGKCVCLLSLNIMAAGETPVAGFGVSL